MKVPFNVPVVTGKEMEYLAQAVSSQKLSGDGTFTKKCHEWFEDNFHCLKALLTTSCTHALEMGAILAGIEPGDEVIMPSYTFVSTANAFVLRGARIVFVDIRPDTMNIDETLIENAITANTRAIVPVHYAGVSCEMEVINQIAEKYGLLVIEDAAQGVLSGFKGRPLGTIGNLGSYSFHDTKNYTSGEGGALIVNDERFCRRAEYIREKGTNRSRFLRGEIDKYTWIDLGSSYLPSELNAAYLYPQLEIAENIKRDRLKSWAAYYQGLQSLAEQGLIELPVVPEGCDHNAAVFFIKVADIEQRTELIDYLKQKGVAAAFHYVPLHSAEAGQRYGRFHGEDVYTTVESERLLRMPLYYGMGEDKVAYVIEMVRGFFNE